VQTDVAPASLFEMIAATLKLGIEFTINDKHHNAYEKNEKNNLKNGNPPQPLFGFYILHSDRNAN
jgi:hypothetical protein